MVEIIKQTIIAVTAVRLVGKELRTVCVKEGSPIEIAYCDDGDATWNVVGEFLDKDDYVPTSNCLLGVNDGRLLFLATAKGRIYRSVDAAEHWVVIEDGVCFNTAYVLLTETLGRVIAINESGTIYSDDNGDTWNSMPELEWAEANSGLVFSGG